MSQPIDLETMRRVAGLAGFEWSDAELEAIRPLVDASLRMLVGLETLPLDEVEPTTQYRIL
jgi:Asp-tRNA(Asn)/Glu-tRNA(Gln) amidotransferase C subunit